MSEALALVGATLAVYFLLFGFEESVARVPSFHVSVLAFVVLFAIGSWLAAKWRLGAAPRVLIALAALALGALVPGGSLAVNPIRLLGVLVGFGMLMYFFRRSRRKSAHGHAPEAILAGQTVTMIRRQILHARITAAQRRNESVARVVRSSRNAGAC